MRVVAICINNTSNVASYVKPSELFLVKEMDCFYSYLTWSVISQDNAIEREKVTSEKD